MDLDVIHNICKTEVKVQFEDFKRRIYTPVFEIEDDVIKSKSATQSQLQEAIVLVDDFKDIINEISKITGLPFLTKYKNAFTRARAHCSADLTAGEWDTLYAPTPL